LDPTQVLLGWLKREAFFRGRPVAYWSKALRNPDPNLQLEARKTLREGGTQAVPVLAELLQEGAGDGWSAAEVRWECAEGLGQSGPEPRPAVPVPIAALQAPDPHVRTVVITTLGEIGPDARQAIPGLIERLQGDQRQVAARALSRFKADA